VSVEVRIPTVLRRRWAGRRSWPPRGPRCGRCWPRWEAAHPGFGPAVLEASGALKRFINVFLNDEDVRYRQGLETPVADGSTLVILPAVAGG